MYSSKMTISALALPGMICSLGISNVVLAELFTIPLYPGGVGDITNLVRSGDDENWKCVDEIVPDDHATYVYTSSLGLTYDLYQMGDSADLGEIVDVTFYARAREYGFGSGGTFRFILKSHDAQQTWGHTGLPDAWVDLSSTLTTNPITGLDWTWEDINELQYGVGLKDDVLGGDTRCTQAYMAVTYVPEPSSLALMACALVLVQRRR